MRTKKLWALANDMKCDQTHIPFNGWKSDPVGAGYTYFGQFIDHDLTEDRTPLRLAGLMEPQNTENCRTPWLDLGSLYGHGPGCPAYRDLYEADEICFRLGAPLIDGQTFDVPLKDGNPLLADQRNSENVILRQIHAMFLKLHNLAAIELKATFWSASPRQLFEKARERVRWQYQWLVRHDYLRRLCNQTVYEDVVLNGNRRIDWTDGFSIPIEFSQAAFRFGHSMVRAKYNLNTAAQEVPLSDLFAAGKKGALDPQLAVSWNDFFEGHETSMRIDTCVVPPLFKLPDEDISRFVDSLAPHSTNALPLRTLLRGAASRLPTGQQVRGELCPEAIISQPIVVSGHPYDPWAILKKLGLADHTPLWYYILLEAEIDENGLRLGRLGSRLVLEVVEASLRDDDESFVSCAGSKWVPPPWKLPDGSDFLIGNLLDLAKFVHLAR